MGEYYIYIDLRGIVDVTRRNIRHEKGLHSARKYEGQKKSEKSLPEQNFNTIVNFLYLGPMVNIISQKINRRPLLENDY